MKQVAYYSALPYSNYSSGIPGAWDLYISVVSHILLFNDGRKHVRCAQSCVFKICTFRSWDQVWRGL